MRIADNYIQQNRLPIDNEGSLISIQEASILASKLLRRDVSISNISYLIQYGKVKKYGFNGKTKININELKDHYEKFKKRYTSWYDKLGDDLNRPICLDHFLDLPNSVQNPVLMGNIRRFPGSKNRATNSARKWRF